MFQFDSFHNVLVCAVLKFSNTEKTFLLLHISFNISTGSAGSERVKYNFFLNINVVSNQQ